MRLSIAAAAAAPLHAVLQECAVLDLMATRMEQQGQGHCSALLQAVEGWLGPQLGVSSLIAVCPADVSARQCI